MLRGGRSGQRFPDVASVLVLFPDSNLRTSKRRPAVVVQPDVRGVVWPRSNFCSLFPCLAVLENRESP